MDRVVFRMEKDKYRGGDSILAIFPDDPANPGRYGVLPFFYRNGRPVFEPYCEADRSYLLNCKIIHKNTPVAERALATVEEYYGERYRIMERIMCK